MADQRHSAYRRLGTARTNLIRSRANVRDIGLEQQFSAASSQMNLQDIANKSEAIAGTLNLVSAGAGLAQEYGETEESIGLIEKLTESPAMQWYGETPIGEALFGRKPGEGELGYMFKGPRGMFTREGWGEAFERLSVLSGMKDPKYRFKGADWTSSQLEATLPFIKLGKKWDDIASSLMPINQVNKTKPKIEDKKKGKYADMTFTEYLDDPSINQELVNRLMAGGWGSATKKWKQIRTTL